ncbi:hypothetical protein OG555_26215 [Kribbella sp. NBC_01484]|uniref:hypothetical protein n=1 Tax=Kribbella sp. NBC_01484 TaxID=2903579 RepID=UPI002E305D93|nr:hypothetical protein [Kribbella sp. NBC_01484]
MSYDLYFLTRQPGQSWEDVMSQLEGDDSEDVPLDDEAVAAWDRVKAAVGPVLADASEFAVSTSRQLNDDATGIQISMVPGELSLTVPYWYTGPDAERIVGILHEVAAAIEQATGLTAYDPQAEAPFLGEGEYGAARTLDRIHTSVIHRHAASEPADRAPRSELPHGLWARLFGRGPR